MVLPSRNEELLNAWRALAAGASGGDGWRTIPLASSSPYGVRAGRRFPGNEEALLVGFASQRLPPGELLPHGQGFAVSRVDLGPDAGNWLALSRLPAGSLDMFTMMAFDIIETLGAGDAIGEERRLSLFVARIRAWQDFMRRGAQSILSPEAEIGLFGELVFLGSMVEAGVPIPTAVDAWVGPLHAVQDFALGGGAVEVKATAATSGFPARIGSLEQLDDSSRQPLLLAAVRLRLDDLGTSLPAIVAQLENVFRNEGGARDVFKTRLLHAGYIEGMAEYYKRAFIHAETRLIPVGSMFPRLIRATLPLAITDACYDVDLDRVEIPPVTIPWAMQQCGVI